MIKNSTWLI